MNYLAVLLLLVPALTRGSIWYHPLATSTTETPERPRIVAANNVNYSISFVPLITLLSGVLPRLINRIRTPTANARGLNSPGVPPEFEGANPCIDSILVRRSYPGSHCFFYQCELYDPSPPACRLQVLHDPDSPSFVDYKAVERNSALIRISNCLAIRVYRCSAGHKYDKSEKTCVKHRSRFYGDDTCVFG